MFDTSSRKPTVEMDKQPARDTASSQVARLRETNGRLINEAIKRILLDIVIRGHGDRLIGRWSREPQIQHFLDQVPYLLDRINQLHLACTRIESLEPNHLHHHHHHQHYHHNRRDYQVPFARSSLSDFINLIGNDLHWLVRTRDVLGLSPLHKAVIYGNRPIAEFIVDRYYDELAACGFASSSRRQVRLNQLPKLIDAQDKYGRTALHYAAAQANYRHGQSGRTSLYHFLVSKNAALDVKDFRGRTASYYLSNPSHLHLKSIIQLSTKLNSNYQAGILSKTLQASSQAALMKQARSRNFDGDEQLHLTDSNQVSSIINQLTRASRDEEPATSISCNDLRAFESNEYETNYQQSSQLQRSKSQAESLVGGFEYEQPKQAQRIAISGGRRHEKESRFGSIKEDQADRVDLGKQYSEVFNFRLNNGAENLHSRDEPELELICKQLKADRSEKQIIDQKTRLKLRKYLSEAKVDKLSELMVDGFGSYIIGERSLCCWNSNCKRYVTHIIPRLLNKLDQLHELVARNDCNSVNEMLNLDPILARMKRPYKRGSLSALHLAIHLNRIEIARLIIGRFPELASQRDSHGATSLHWAAKSLRHDSLYCWLLETFGHRLEQMRDFRGRSACEYQQQAIRMASLLSSQPSPKLRQQSAREIIHLNQIKSNQLNFTGQKVKLERRSLRNSTPLIINNNMQNQWDLTSLATDTQSPELLDKSIEIAIETPSSKSGDISNKFDPIRLIKPTFPPLSRPSSFRRHSVQVMRPNRLGGRGADDDLAKAFRRSSDTKILDVLTRLKRTNTKEPSVWQKAKNELAELRKNSSKNSDNNKIAKNLLAEMVQVDSSDLSEVKSPTLIDKSPMEDRKSIPASDESTSQLRPESAASRRKLEQIILDGIQGEDYKKLEHLLLAGCGQKMLDFYARSSSLLSDQLSSEMVDFLENHTPAYIETIERTHDILHKSYAYCNSQHTINLEAEFHKLCNLLNGNGLIMSRDSFGASPMHIATLRCDSRLADYLIKRQTEVISAPDLMGRNSIHYAAITLRAQLNHQTLKLIRLESRSPDHAKLSSGGFWLVDDTAQLIYNMLQDMGTPLMQMKDRRGFTPTDYLNEPQVNHVDLSDKLPAVLEASIIEKCCPAYSQLLSRYNYMIENSRQSERPLSEVINSGTEIDLMTVPKVGFKEDKVGADLNQTKIKSTAIEAKLSSGKRQSKSKSSSAKISSSSSSLIRGIERDLSAPERFPVPQMVTQIAPKPVVGCSIGFPPISSSPTNLQHPLGSNSSLNLLADAKQRRRQQHQQQQRYVADATSRKQDPQTNPKSFAKNFRKARSFERSQGHKSIFGGVIVPTVVHDEQAGDLESYDIIYRQPTPTKTQFEAVMTSSEDDSSPLKSAVVKTQVRQNKSHGVADDFAPNSQSLSETSNSNDSHNSSDEEDDDDEDSDGDSDSRSIRIERLSSEFDVRVTKEKDELRAKVDQIMTSIRNGHQGKGDALHNQATTSNLLIGSRVANGNLIEEALQSSIGKSLSSSQNSSTFTSSASSVSSTSSSSATHNSAMSKSQSHSSAIESHFSSASSLALNQQKELEIESKSVSRGMAQQGARQQVNLPALKKQTSIITTTVSKNTFGQTYLHFVASRPQSSSSLYKVLDHAAHLIGERDTFYRTARDVAMQFNMSDNVMLIDEFIIDSFIGAKTSLLRHLLNQGYSPLIHVADSDGNDIMLILKLLKLDKMILFLLQMADFQRWRDELHTFIRHGYSAGVSELIRKHKDLVRAKSVHARTSVHLAVLFDRQDIIDELLEVDPTGASETDNMGRTPLHYSFGLLQTNTQQIRAKLVEKGADPEQRDVKMRMPKYYTILRAEIEELRRMELELN